MKRVDKGQIITLMSLDISRQVKTSPNQLLLIL